MIGYTEYWVESPDGCIKVIMDIEPSLRGLDLQREVLGRLEIKRLLDAFLLYKEILIKRPGEREPIKMVLVYVNENWRQKK